MNNAIRDILLARTLSMPTAPEMLDAMDTVIRPEVRDAVMLALSEGGETDVETRIAQVAAELVTIIQNGAEKVDDLHALTMAKIIVEACARSLDRLGGGGSGTAQ